MKTKLFPPLLVLLTSLQLGLAADLLSEALQKGLFEEEANHNLDAAIKAYQSVIAQVDEQRKLAATAVFRLGECYRKLGQTNDAVAQYQRVLRDYSEQTTLANLSRQTLAGLGSVAPGAQSPALSRAAREQKRLLEEEIKLFEKELARIKELFQQKVASESDVSAKERQLLGLRRQLAALDASSEDPAVAQAAAGATDEEEKEVRRIKALIKDSPDLINGRGGDYLSPLHTAASAGQLVVARFLLDSGADVNIRGGPERSPPLHSAVSGGHKSMVELLLARGADVNAQDKDDKTALHGAAQNGFKTVVDVLLANKANPNLREKYGSLPLHSAAGKPNRAVVEALVAAGSDVNARNKEERTPLHSAALAGQRDVVTFLLSKGVDVEAKDLQEQTPLHYAAARGNKELVQSLLAGKANPNARDKKGNTALYLAALANQPPAVEALLAGGADPEAEKSDEDTPLMLAIRSNVPLFEVARTLLEGKADPNHGYKNGNRPLHAAVSAQKKYFVALLLKHGANPDVQYADADGSSEQKGSTPLMMAASGNLPEIVQLLLDARANPSIRRDDGTVPLHYALYHKHKVMVEELLKHGANVEARDTHGETPLTIAVTREEKAIVELLLAHRADVNARSADELTPLHKAVGFGQRAIIDLLLAAKADVNAADGKGRTPLDYVREGVNLKSPSGGRRGAFPAVPMQPGSIGGIVGSTPGQSAAGAAQRELAETLKKNGAVDWAPRPNAITIIRRETGATKTVFTRNGPNDFNRYTLFEALAAKGWLPIRAANEPDWFFPDFSKVSIIRRDPATGKIITLPVDAAAAVAAMDCTRDVALEWGDLIDVPESEHKLGESWRGLPIEFTEVVAKCLTRKITLTVKGQTEELTLAPQLGDSVGNPTSTSETVHSFASVPFRLRATVQNSGRLLTTSDTSRVKVRRTDPATKQKQEWTFNLSAPASATFDLWLRDGDEIEVPEREAGAVLTLPAPSASGATLEGRAIPVRPARPPAPAQP